MGNAIGLTTVLMTGVESTYGTPVALTRAFEINSESLDRKNEIVPSDALRGGTRSLRRGSRRVITARQGMGDVTMQVVTNGMGRWFQQALGGTSTITQIGVTSAWQQLHTMGSLLGKSQTVQKQLRDQSNTTVGTFTFHGVKTNTMELSISKKGVLMATFGLDAEDVETATAAGTPAYASTRVFHFAQGALVLGGSYGGGAMTGGTSPGCVTDATIKLDNHLNTDEFCLGGLGLKNEPIEDAYPEVTGSMSIRFNGPTAFYDAFAADTALGLSLIFTGSTFSGSGSEVEQLLISIPEVRLTGEMPKVSGPGIVSVNVPFEGQFDGTNTGMAIVLKSADTSI